MPKQKKKKKAPLPGRGCNFLCLGQKAALFLPPLYALFLPEGIQGGYSLGWGGVGHRGRGLWDSGHKGAGGKYLSQSPALPPWVERALRLGKGAAQV